MLRFLGGLLRSAAAAQRLKRLRVANRLQVAEPELRVRPQLPTQQPHREIGTPQELPVEISPVRAMPLAKLDRWA